LPRHFLNRDPSLVIKSADTDYKVIQNFGTLTNVHLAKNSRVQSQKGRLNIRPMDGLVLLETIYQKDTFDVVWLDIMDERHYGEHVIIKHHNKFAKEAPRKRSIGEESTESLLYDPDFYKILKVNSGIVVSLYKKTPEDIAAIKRAAAMDHAIHLTFALFDTIAQKDVSVLILSDRYITCDSVAQRAAAFPTNTIKTPLCTKI
jgi:hypothetical protein